jgi:predicted permease
MFRYSIRMLRKNPGFTGVIIVTLALGIGLNTAIFSLADAMLFHPVAAVDLDRLVFLGTRDSGRYLQNVSPADYLDIREQARTLDGVSAYLWWAVNITGGQDAERVQGFQVTGDFFRTMGIPALIGRTLQSGDDVDGKNRVVVITEALWKRRFGADPSIAGQTIEVNSGRYEVVGVMPDSFKFPRSVELWAPFAITGEIRAQRTQQYMNLIARLKPGVDQREANAEMKRIGDQLAQAYPISHARRTLGAEPLAGNVLGEMAGDLAWMLLSSVGLVLLLACVNVANLRFARVSERQAEMSVRAALGASRASLIGQLLVESIMLACLGGLAGLIVAVWGIDLIKGILESANLSKFVPGWDRLGLNPWNLTYAFILALVSGILAGIMPAFAGSGGDIQSRLRALGRSSTTRHRHRITGSLVVFQIVLALTLMVQSALMARGMNAVRKPAQYVEPDQSVAMRVVIPNGRYAERDALHAFTRKMLNEFSTVAGVSTAGLISHLPYSSSSSGSTFVIEGAPQPKPGETPSAMDQTITSGYFSAMRQPIVRGRGFLSSDDSKHPLVVIVSESLARRYFPNADPVGKRIKFGFGRSSDPWREIVGVAADIRHHAFDRDFRPTIFRPFEQTQRRSFDVLIATSGPAQPLLPSIRAALRKVDPAQPVSEFGVYRQFMELDLGAVRLLAVLLWIFGAIALVLAATGVFSMMANSVTERTQEIGIRMALGANKSIVMRLILRRGLLLTGCGLVLGLGLSAILTRMQGHLLFGIEALDPVTFVLATIVMLASAGLACYFPGRRAASVDPLVSLRQQ